MYLEVVVEVYTRVKLTKYETCAILYISCDSDSKGEL